MISVLKGSSMNVLKKVFHLQLSNPSAKFPRNIASHFEDYLICVTTLKDGHDNSINESRSPGVDKERNTLGVV